MVATTADVQCAIKGACPSGVGEVEDREDLILWEDDLSFGTSGGNLNLKLIFLDHDPLESIVHGVTDDKERLFSSVVCAEPSRGVDRGRRSLTIGRPGRSCRISDQSIAEPRLDKDSNGVVQHI